MLESAIAFAAARHAGQVDRRQEPYILHPLRIMLAVRQASYPESYQCVAVLHDILEDTFTTPGEIEQTFGHLIVAPVLGLTRRFEPLEGRVVDEYGARKWGNPLETYQEYFKRCVANEVSQVVKYYDLLDNADPRRFTPNVSHSRYAKSLEWYYENGNVLEARKRKGVS
jgi:GTP diphosphokinase / guanosine-3',5'-bis(diphosphate) 3'-diphosphatase